MKKGIVIAVLAVFSVFAVGPAFAAVGADGKLTVDKPAAKFPAKKLNADGTKKKNPVTFNHTKHGALGCVKCHHQDKDLKAGGTPAKLCFDCHGAAPDAANAKQVDAYEMIHGKTAGCIACHKTDAAAMAAKAPTACKGCHGGAE
jgi:Class III cytochrome C family